ncbi:FtsK/SpoIIIE domain-containing protein [Priestia megaterium]|uniref:FtsK/SpoIIIE domain-containing protein n=1 Tax=Priestia megaterium TaxID=1404 RepID=UPI002E24C6E5|nr:FtsK/SpoIIIE domain-containing protein [Priestia megaterium]MED3976791.1 FtsK/SpoIIIE domain-containing protein [Priestia megaterium]
MFELLIPVTAGAAALLFGRKKAMQDTEMIELVFKNAGVGYKRDQVVIFPKLIDTDEIENGTIYIYNTVVGLPDKVLAPLNDLLACTLNKPIKLEYDKFLRITVYHENLPDKVFYHEIPKNEGWVVPLGRNLEGWHFHDFDKVPHMTNSGTTRFGKTVMLKTMMTYLIENHPEDVEFLLIDLKGGLEFNKYRNLKQVRGVCKDVAEAYLALEELHGVLAKTMNEFLSKGWSNILDTPSQKRLFVIVDEAAQLAPEKWMDKDTKAMMGACQWYLSEIARVAGSLGVRLIYTTQYPTADTLPRQIKQNSDVKVSFRLPTSYASEVAIDDKGAEKLSSYIKGRALIKTHEIKEVQTPLITDKEMLRRVKKYAVKKAAAKKEAGTDYSAEIR